MVFVWKKRAFSKLCQIVIGPQFQNFTLKCCFLTWCRASANLDCYHGQKELFKGVVSWDFGGLQIIFKNRASVLDVPLKVFFFTFSYCSYSFKTSVGKSFFWCTYQKLSVRPGTICLPWQVKGCSSVSVTQGIILLYKKK